MESDELTQCTQNTQGVMDPRRMGLNNSGLSAEDCSDVMCILHPATPAAYQLVAETARRSPQHILQSANAPRYRCDTTDSMAEEQETFILDGNGADVALDLAFRFSSETVRPHLGFTFGRNMNMCDIAPATDTHKRVSNQHFIIYMNESGVLMLNDLSTNGTMVDDVLLKGKSNIHPTTRMLTHGSILQILSPTPEETLKFIIRLPSRQGYHSEYEAKFRDWIDRKMEAEVKYSEEQGHDLQLAPKRAGNQRPNTAVKAPIVQNQYGMHWNGGDKYNVVGQIGKGAFASVYQLATKSDGQLYAAKELEKRKFMKNGVLDRKLENEMHIMQRIDHPSIVQYHGYQDAASHLYIIMEFVPCGDLQQFLNEYGPLPEGMAKQVATQVFDALDYLHKKRITHRDIKPDNILLASMDADNFVIKLSDFGLSKVVKDNDTFLKTFCGTLLYCAPEVFPHYDAHVSGKGTKRPRKPPPQQHSNKFHSYSQAVDIWSFGAVLWYSLCLRPPFEGVSDNTGRGMFDKIMMTPLDAGDLVKQGVSDDAVAMLVEMLNTDPSARPSAETCMRHAWFGNQQMPARRPVDFELGAIVEEIEADPDSAGEPDVGSLSLDERQQGSHDSEVSLNSEDFHFFDPRKSKKFKTNDMERHQEEENFIDSYAELYESIPIMHDDQQQDASGVKTKPPKLFGEISRSELHNPAFGRRASTSIEKNTYIADAREPRSDHSQPNGKPGSLQGTESMVRDMNMHSPFHHDIGSGVENEAAKPLSSSDLSQAKSSQEMQAGNSEETPKADNSDAFRRQISIPLPPSFYYEPEDPSTHNIEYASKVSGRDFVSDPAYKLKDTPPPDSMTSSCRSGTKNGSVNDQSALGATAQEAPRRSLYGRLISTSDSADFDMALNHDITTFGRSKKSTYVWPDESDIRIGKDAMTIFFWNDKMPKSKDIADMYCQIVTHGSNGLQINGTHLEKDTLDRHCYGCLFSGDEIEVCKPNRDKPGLKFVVQIHVGKSKVRRPRFGSDEKFNMKVATPESLQPRRIEKEATAGGAERDELDKLF